MTKNQLIATGNESVKNITLNNFEIAKVGAEKPVETVEEAIARMEWLFKSCGDAGVRVTYEKMCLVLGRSRSYVDDLLYGKKSVKYTELAHVLRTYKQIIESVDADLALNGEIPANVYMFRAKNFYGLRDDKGIAVRQEAAEELETVDVKAIEARYAELPVVEEDD